MKKYKIIFAGTPEFSILSLQALFNAGHTILAVYTQPDRPAGRGQNVTASPVKLLAQQYQLPIEQPATLNDPQVQQKIVDYNPDIVVVIAYGLILPESILKIPHYGCLNVHASLLPRWRGAAPIQRAILAGDQETGVTIMQMAKGLDTGPMLSQLSYAIAPTDNAHIVQNQLAKLGADALLSVMDRLSTNQIQAIAQNEQQASYANKIKKTEAKIHWHQSAEELDRLVRAFNPWPMAFAEFANKQIRIWQAAPIKSEQKFPVGTIIHADTNGIDVACGNGILRLQQLQFPGGKTLSARDVINAGKLTLGQVFL